MSLSVKLVDDLVLSVKEVDGFVLPVNEVEGFTLSVNVVDGFVLSVQEVAMITYSFEILEQDDFFLPCSFLNKMPLIDLQDLFLDLILCHKVLSLKQ